MRLRDLFRSGGLSRESAEGALDRAGILLLCLYLLAGLIYSACVPAVPRYYDEADYLQMSNHLLHGQGFSLDGVHPTASRPPGYIFFLTTIRAIGGGFFGFRVAQFLLMAATIILVCRIGSERKIFAGLLLVTGLVICYPVLFYTCATLYPQPLSEFLFLLALSFNLASPRGVLLNLASGLVFGILILVVPTFLFTLLVVQGVASFYKFVRVRDMVVILFIAALVVGSWTARNAIVFHRFVPLASNSGMNLLMGNNGQPAATEAASNSIMTPYFQRSIDLGLDEFQADQFYRDTALNWIETHPGAALVNYFEKVLNFFNIVNGYTHEASGEVSVKKQIVMALSYLLLLGLLAWRLVEWKRFPLTSREKFFLVVYVLSAFTSAIFFTRIRLRLPYDFLIMAVIALHLSRRLEIWMTGTSSPEASSTLDGKKTARRKDT